MKLDLSFRIRYLSKLIRRCSDHSPAKKQMEKVTGLHGWFIGFLYNHREEDIYQRDLEKAFQMGRSTVSHVLGLMEQNGLIERVSVEKDARLKKIVLTEKASAMHEAFDREMSELENTMTQGLSPSEKNALNFTIERMIANLETLEKQYNETEAEA